MQYAGNHQPCGWQQQQSFVISFGQILMLHSVCHPMPFV